MDKRSETSYREAVAKANEIFVMVTGSHDVVPVKISKKEAMFLQPVFRSTGLTWRKQLNSNYKTFSVYDIIIDSKSPDSF